MHYYNPIDTVPPLKRVDARPYGGGPGMVLQAGPLLSCFDQVKEYSGTRKAIFFTPGGEQFTQEKAKEYAEYDNIVLFCGHYEGMDERVAIATGADRVSIGPYTLTGGEVPAMLVADAVVRELPGALGNEMSCERRRVAGGKVYTRPKSFTYDDEVYTVPDVLCSGNHRQIDEYRRDS